MLRKPPGYRNSLALCVLDAIWSMGVRYTAVEHVTSRYRDYRRGQGADPDRDSLADLLMVIDRAGSGEGLAEVLRNHQRTATRNGVLEADAVAIAARILASHGINTPEGLRGRHQREPGRRGEGGLANGSRATVRHQVGMPPAARWLPRVKPDRVIRRFVADALQIPDIGPEDAVQLVTAVQQANLGASLIALDHEIRQSQRGVKRAASPVAARSRRSVSGS